MITGSLPIPEQIHKFLLVSLFLEMIVLDIYCLPGVINGGITNHYHLKISHWDDERVNSADSLGAIISQMACLVVEHHHKSFRVVICSVDESS